MKCLLLVTIALGGAGCLTTAAVGPNAAADAPRWSTEDASPDARTAAADDPSDQPGVAVTATSPIAVDFRSDAKDTVVPLRTANPRPPSRRRAMVHDAMWIGAAVGVVAGAALGQQRDSYAAAHPDASCDPFACGGNALLSGVGFGAIGLGLGAAAGGIAALIDRLWSGP